MAVRRLLLFLLATGLLVAGASLPYRAAQAPDERRVEFAISLSDARSFSAQHIYSLADVLEAYRAAGISTAVVGEKTLYDLVSQGQVGYPVSYPVDLAVVSGLEAMADIRGTMAPVSVQPQLDTVYIFVRGNAELAGWIARQLVVGMGADRVGRLAGPDLGAPETTEIVTVRTEKEWLYATPLGIFPQDVQTVLAAGLNPVYSFRQSRGMSTASPVSLLDDLPPEPQRILFTGDAVPGWPFDLEPFATKLHERGDSLLIDYRRNQETGQLVRVAGLERLVDAVDQRALKVYRPWVGERMEDWVTAVKDRSMRFLLMPAEVLSKHAEEDIAKQVGQVRELRAQLEGFGFSTGPAQPRPAVTVPTWGLVAAVVAIAAGGAWLALLAGGSFWALASLVLLVGGSLGALFVAGLAARQFLALGAALIFPVLGGMWALESRRPGWLGMVEVALRAVLPAFAGGLLVHAVLSDTTFFLEMNLFKGVKVALVLPVILLWIVLAIRERRAALGTMGKAFEWPVRTGHLLLLGIALVAAVVLLIRSTNQMDPTATTVQPSDLELKVRALLEQVLVARPRFKEFLFGYPVLALAAWLLQAGHRRWAQVALAVGLVAGASVINSFSHLHHPLYLSLLRGLHGLWTGLLVGAVAYALARRLIFPSAGRDRNG